MKRAIRILAIAPILAASLAIARADSFAGSDWLFSLQGSLIVTGPLSTITVSNQPITINQTSSKCLCGIISTWLHRYSFN
jgi:hypothetical protein